MVSIRMPHSNTFISAAAVFMGLFIALVMATPIAQPVFAAESCDLAPAVALEVGIGSSSSSTGLTNYISQIYQFVIGSIGVVAAVMIIFNGMRWVTAAGNSENISTAKGGISSAVVGLLIALLSYVLLYAVNTSLVNLVDICPDGLDFSDSTASTIWATCPGGQASECSAVSYCIYEGGCECANISQGDGNAYVCRPAGTHVVPVDGICQNDENCVQPLKCVGNSPTNPGVCKAAESGKSCIIDSDCTGGLKCTAVSSSLSRCLETAGRSNGTFCESSPECESSVCNTTLGVNICVAGDATTDERCTSDRHCANGYECNSTTERCVAKAVGSWCETKDIECGAGLYCVENDNIPGFSTCRDGSVSSYCDGNNECDTGFCGKNVCTAGVVGNLCDDDSDCASGFHCDYSGINSCQPN